MTEPKPCVYRARMVGESHCVCTHWNVRVAGNMPIGICQECALRQEDDALRRPASDFFQQTERLLLVKHRTGEIKAAAKDCGGCGGVKRPDGPALQFIWCYWGGAAEGDELRWSMRSVERFFQGRAKLTIIGDRPEWFDGHVIRKKRVKRRKHLSFRDMLGKVFFMTYHAEVMDQHVWIMDDTYFCKPFSISDLIPRAERWRRSTKNRWQRIKTDTMNALAANGRPQWDYATHAPHLVDKKKLGQVFEGYNLHQNTMLWEVLYGNTFTDNPARSRPWFHRFSGPGLTSPVEYQRALRHSTCFNHTAGHWCPALREYLQQLLPDKVDGETKDPGGFKLQPRAHRSVKRRPLFETMEIKREMAQIGEIIPEGTVAQDQTIPHIMIVQSSYSDPQLSMRRLAITRHTIIPALAYQTRKPVVHIAVNPNDPYTEERLQLYSSTGCEIVPIMRPDWKLYAENWELPDGRKIVSRCDDDDVISKDFCERVYNAAPPEGEFAILWPNGYVFWREQIHEMHHPGNQFCSLVTDRQWDPHQEAHWKIRDRWQTKIAGTGPGWIWFRHGDAATSTISKYRRRQVGRIDSDRIPINLRAMLRAAAGSGVPSSSYKTHRSPHIQYVLQQNAQFKGRTAADAQ